MAPDANQQKNDTGNKKRAAPNNDQFKAEGVAT